LRLSGRNEDCFNAKTFVMELRNAGEALMCDYSLHAINSRPARAGETLITTGFQGTASRGFGGKDDPGTAVCLKPGTELAFHDEPKREGLIAAVMMHFGYGHIGSKLARFRKLSLDQPTHHDALEFANGTIVYVNALREGHKATVLQLPMGEAEPGSGDLARTQSRNTADA
jgi:hypothetical protein